ncbi:MAG: 50S ribosomal protein L32 [candidate division KSB1 bacterium]|nr:50S ribosomal protein L32 [candidate division KSB1 bacterium]
MPNPKRRHSRTRRDKRRTHWKLSAPTIVVCSNCRQPKLPHRVCPNCGYYGERSVFLPRER